MATDSLSTNVAHEAGEKPQTVTDEQMGKLLGRVSKKAAESPTGSAWGSTSDILVETPGESEEDTGEDTTESSNSSTSYLSESSEDGRDGSESGESLASMAETDSASGINSNDLTNCLSDSSGNKADGSRSAESLARTVKIDSASGKNSNDNDHGENDLPVPHPTNDVWIAKFWSSDGHRRVPTTRLIISDEWLNVIKSNHDKLIHLSRRNALVLADLAQARYKEFLRDLEGKSHNPEVGNDDIDLERPLYPIARDNVSKGTAAKLLRATLKAREAAEIAEALSLCPSHLIKNVKDMEDIMGCVDNIKEKCRALENRDASTDPTLALTAESEKEAEEVARPTNSKESKSHPNPSRLNPLYTHCYGQP